MNKNKKIVIVVLIVLSLGIGLFALTYENPHVRECLVVDNVTGLEICE